ncbi:MAG: 4-hydroxythreonine-4-phosphate dehydrogenase PdxA [Firmicutes bacterium]|nr:4-hydroxythreonine-4-phosphate dehydrogenase PdxA [Bacillota bacterium]
MANVTELEREASTEERTAPQPQASGGEARPVLALTMGDVAGIGPEIVVKALARPEVHQRARCLILGDVAVLEKHLRFWPETAPVQPTVHQVTSPAGARWEPGVLNILQPGEPLGEVAPGRLSATAGRGAVEFVKGAVELAKAGQVAGILTAPLNKAAIHMAGFPYPGHTELLAESFGAARYSLVLSARGLFIFHVTTHVSLREAIERITKERVLAQIRLAHLLAKALGQEETTIAVAGLNPHAGEGGLFGNEEEVAIGPAVEEARAAGIPVDGPLPADVAFPRAAQGRYRFVIAMYHDQGHAVFKSLYFDEGVNITVGLPIIRTSVDHGTAFDIAGQGVANEASLVQAIELAARLGPKWGEIWREAQALI